MVRTEIRDQLGMPNNVVTPAIKELIDQDMVLEGQPRLSKTTNKPGKQLYVADDWTKELDSQNRIFEQRNNGHRQHSGLAYPECRRED